MNMRFLFLFSILICTLPPMTANCQETPVSSPTPPPGSLIRGVPEYADWTATYKYSGDNKSGTDRDVQAALKGGKPLPQTRQERVIKTKDISYFLWMDESGAKEECWNIRGVQWITPKGSRQRELAMNPDAPYFKHDLQTSVFLQFKWISPSNYIGIQKFMDKECMVFQMGDQTGKQIVLFAYIDLRTKLPVLFKTSKMVCTYNFGPPPSQKLTIPDDIAGFLRQEAERTAKIMAPGAQ